VTSTRGLPAVLRWFLSWANESYAVRAVATMDGNTTAPCCHLAARWPPACGQGFESGSAVVLEPTLSDGRMTQTW